MQGDVYDGSSSSTQTLSTPALLYDFHGKVLESYSGKNVQGRWQHTFSDTSDMTLKLYYDQVRDAQTRPLADFIESTVNTYDADLQHRFQASSSHNVTWGLGYRHFAASTHNAATFSFAPSDRDFQLLSSFVQDEVSLIPNTLKAIIGARLEHNDFSGFEGQPNGRLAFTPDKHQTIWASIARAVRIPNRLDHDLSALYLWQVAPGVFLSRQGNSRFDSEKLIAYELGYRTQPTQKISIDIAAFYNHYDELDGGTLGAPYFDTRIAPHLTQPIMAMNNMQGNTYGVELMSQWQATNWWRVQANYTNLQMQLRGGEGLLSQFQTTAGSSPQHQVGFKSSFDLAYDTQFDVMLRYVDQLPAIRIDSYVTMDLRLGWKPTQYMELAVVGRNLLNDVHQEFADSGLLLASVNTQRSIYGQVTLRY